MSLTNEQVEGLCPMVIDCNVDEIGDINKLQALMKISQKLLRYKDNQVESLLLECKELKESISLLKPASSARIEKGESTDVISEVRANRKRSDHSKMLSNFDKSRSGLDKVETLMGELQNLDKENKTLRERLSELKGEMEDATERMNDVTEELHTARMKSIECNEKLLKLEQENVALNARIAELSAQQIERDKAIDQFGIAIDARISDWKVILDERDLEIERLKENLSRSMMHSFTTVKEETKSAAVDLKKEVARKDKIIVELQTRLSEAVTQMNDSASMMEQLKSDAKKAGRIDDRREDEGDLQKKINNANLKMSELRRELVESHGEITLKSQQLCEALSTLRKYESKNEGLRETLKEVKELKIELDHKNEHIENLVVVVNKLEALNSCLELELTALREKLGIPDDECVSISKAAARRKEELRKIDELIGNNKNLMEENLEMKSDIRVLKYKLYNKSGISVNLSDCATVNGIAHLESTKIECDKQDCLVDVAEEATYTKNDVDLLKKNVQIVIEENEALRTGMHEILDSIRSQDGQSSVEVHSNTLERLLEALDVRHLAGWYHPAMRLQERLNVVQGSNAELRLQLRNLRKELQRREEILQGLVLVSGKNADRVELDDSEYEREASYSSEFDRLQLPGDKIDAREWTRREEELVVQLNEMKDTMDALKVKLESYERDWRIIESSGKETIAKEFAAKSREFAEAAAEILVTRRKVSALQELLSKETESAYRRHKEAINRESRMKRALADSDKHIKTLESEVETLQSNLLNSVSMLEYKELKERYEETSIRLRASLDMINLTIVCEEKENALACEVEVVERDDEQQKPIRDPMTQMAMATSEGAIDDMAHRMKHVAGKEHSDRQSVEHIARLYAISQRQLKKYESNARDLVVANSELQERIVMLHKRLSNEIVSSLGDRTTNDDNRARDLREENELLKTENDNLKRCLEISRDEARAHYTLNSCMSLELDSLRHQIVDLQAITEDKAMISRLDFELTRRKLSEMELDASKIKLEDEMQRLEDELVKEKRRCEKMQLSIWACRKECEDRCRAYVDIIAFLQCQYATCTSATSLERVAAVAEQLRSERETVRLELNRAKECRANAKLQQEVLVNRLEIVDRLKDMLERRIGNDTVEEVMRDFSQISQKFVSEFRYKRQIAHLEYELQIANDKCAEYKSVISAVENEMLNVQRVWGQRWSGDGSGKQLSKSKVISSDRKTMGVQAVADLRSEEAQTDPYTCCLSGNEDEKTSAVRVMPKERGEEVEEMLAAAPTAAPTAAPAREENIDGGKNSELTDKDLASWKDIVNDSRKGEAPHDSLMHAQANSPQEIENDSKPDRKNDLVQVLNDQLNEALRLASERSMTLMRYESQMAEYRTTINSLRKSLEEKDSLSAEMNNADAECIFPSADDSDKLALRSTVQSLQRLIAQKEETVLRYQKLLKEDRDEHCRAAALSQKEVEALRGQVRTLQEELVKCQQQREPKMSTADSATDNVYIIRENVAVQQDEIARLCEQVSTLEADLKVAKEISDRWHRLAEERLRHVDKMRESLEGQHKNELESYRSEIDKWQSEVSVLRQRLSDNRVALTKGNVSLMKELQEREEKIHELSLTCQQLQNEVDLVESSARSHRYLAQNEQDAKKSEPTVCVDDYNHISSQQQREQEAQLQTVSILRRQIQSLVEKEKLYKGEIVDLKQRLSRRYMATKMQEKRTFQREGLLERKVKSLEEELEKTQALLDREYMVHETKRVKTAQDLSLWEKQKMWQQTAEKLRGRLRERSDECEKLRANYEKLRSVVACMEREKRFLRGKLKGELTKTAVGAGNCCYCTTARPMSVAHNSLVDDLREECQTLRNRVNELTDRLEKENSGQLMRLIDEQKRRIVALEALTQADPHVTMVSQLEKLEAARENLEKKNLSLESENFRLQLEIVKANSDAPGLREKVAHLEKYVEILKAEKSSDSTPRSFERESRNFGTNKSVPEMERTIFSLKRVVEKLQSENKRLRISAKKSHLPNAQGRVFSGGEPKEESTAIYKQYEGAQKRIVALEIDLQFAQQKISILEHTQREDENTELNLLKEQLVHKSELLDKVKYLLTRAAINEKNLRQRVQQLELCRDLSIIPECHVTPSTQN